MNTYAALCCYKCLFLIVLIRAPPSPDEHAVVTNKAAVSFSPALQKSPNVSRGGEGSFPVFWPTRSAADKIKKPSAEGAVCFIH